MTFLLAVQVLFTISTILLLFGIAGIMITNDQDDRWLIAIATGAIGFFALGITWGLIESKAPCCRCPAEQVQRP
jgi:hypothetical protein